ncbi:MAG: DUF4835 family protein [Bacteroidetes bacterium]|nr:DUF4835 family protein [Bacteroidota bacterium]MBP7400852.1 DUF4835 family protein [Chitinophagales bacterium]MBK7109237.1 DUF4835 family protein [Bacteroidota bacterium]MBK8488441.1 DUF4835 family protein [Bacteroidota bacterium]MBK8681796.1 DUF4835 family protein [Bacteroidota bacterium]
MRNLLFFIFLICSAQFSIAQELRCGITINTQQLTTTDVKVFKTLETAIREFMNNRRWTDDIFLPEEKIDCEIIITVTEEQSAGRYKAQASIISRRPVFGTDYNSTVVNTVDKDFEFAYTEYEPLDFNENTFQSNLTSSLAFYAFIIIGMDYDTFSDKGGEKYFQKAFTIVTQATSREEKGWKAYDGTRNRYWLINNILDVKYAGLRDVYYSYHRQALDQMSEKPADAVKVVLGNLQSIDNINKSNPNSMYVQLFFTAKSDELVGIFSKAIPQDRAKAANFLMKLDPVNIQKYQSLVGGN